MSILHNKLHSRYHNYIKTRWYPDHLAVLNRYQDIKYTKYKNEYVNFSELRIPTSLGYIDIEHNISAALETDTIDITMIFISSTIRCYVINDTRTTSIEYLNFEVV